MAHFCRRLVLAWLFVAGPALAADKPRNFADTLALQEAMRAGRELLVRGENGKAVELLEKQIDRNHGDPTYFVLLKDAYTSYIKDLQLAGKLETVEVYRKRLAVLDKKESKPALPPVEKPTVPRGDIVRGARPDEDPFQQVPISDREMADQLVAQAGQAFAAKNYSEACDLFARASKAGPALPAAQQSQWAYCMLSGTVAKLNAPNPPAGSSLVREVKSAMAMAPKDGELEKFGRKVLEEIGKRFGVIRHSEGPDSWAKAESANFRLFHKKTVEEAEQLLFLAEQFRTTGFAKWSAAKALPWQPVCEIYLYQLGADYAKATNQPATAPGHSTIKTQNGKVATRRMDLRADEPNLMGSVLPHEITHVVLGELFADATLPRWADEGMAVLAEPRSQIDRYARTLVRCRTQGKLLPLASILSRPEYPDAAAVTVFYVESVSVVEFLVNQKGPAEFVQFVRDSSRGFDAALAKHYDLRTVADLQDRWLRATFTEIDRATGSGGR